MAPATWVNSFGLILDVVGFVLLFRFALPQELSRTGAQHLTAEEDDPAEAAKAARYDRISRWALALVVAGFLLQLVSNYL